MRETSNHFRLFDYMLETAEDPLSSDLFLEYHRILKDGTEQAAMDAIYTAGTFKTLPNEIGDMLTCEPFAVQEALNDLIDSYYETSSTFESIIDFHGALSVFILFRMAMVASGA